MPVGGKLRALVADDHEQMWSAVERILGDRFDVRYVPDGKALLDALEETMPDVVILDISMPKMSGLEALRALHARGGDLPPTVICSMHREPAFLDAALKAGAKGYVYKARAPFDLARARTRTFGANGTTFAESSPGFEVKDPKWIRQSAHEAPPCEGILALYNRGDRRRWCASARAPPR